MEKNSAIEEDIERALSVLKNGGTILYPTDTIWGIGCDATDASAIEKIFGIKSRDKEKSLIALVSSEDMLARWVRNIPEVAWDLIGCSEKPTTIIYDNPSGIAPNALAEDGSMGIRITKDDFCRRLIERLKTPLISTSANVSGEASPADFAAVSPRIREAVDYVVNWRQQERNNPPASTLIKLTNDSRIKIIRP